jgi:hypothetical protein
VAPPTRRFVTPWVYSWYTTLASSAVCRCELVTRPMRITGRNPSLGVNMLAVAHTGPG